MAKFTHKGVDIILDETTGIFWFDLAGKRYTKKSLAAVKKVIDTPPTFTPFEVLQIMFYNQPPVVGRVIGVVRPSRRHYSNFQFELENGKHETRVLLNTPANIAAMEELRVLEAQHELLREEMSKAIQAVREKIVYLSADTFVKEQEAKRAKG